MCSQTRLAGLVFNGLLGRLLRDVRLSWVNFQAKALNNDGVPIPIPSRMSNAWMA
jgi:hypothetical protein